MVGAALRRQLKLGYVYVKSGRNALNNLSRRLGTSSLPTADCCLSGPNFSPKALLRHATGAPCLGNSFTNTHAGKFALGSAPVE